MNDFPPAVVPGRSNCVRVIRNAVASPARQPGQMTRADVESSQITQKKTPETGLFFALQNKGVLHSLVSRNQVPDVDLINKLEAVLL